MKLCAHIENWELLRPFRIAGAKWTTATVVVVQISDGKYIGRGEAQGVYYLHETPASILKQVEAVADRIEQDISREQLPELLPSGGARNAIDCALWDLDAKRSGRTIWQLTGIDPHPVVTAYTIGIEPTAEMMADHAAAAAQYPVLKIKLDDDQPIERLVAIRAARPDAELIVDANQAWSFDLLTDILPQCVSLNLTLIEQPLPRGGDEALDEFESPIPLAADESCLDTSELDTAANRYDVINIKLDKTGGLTEALRLARATQEKSCKLMVGNMMGTSLAMAPALVVAQLCDYIDIDGPLLQKFDHPGGITYTSAEAAVFDPTFWG